MLVVLLLTLSFNLFLISLQPVRELTYSYYLCQGRPLHALKLFQELTEASVDKAVVRMSIYDLALEHFTDATGSCREQSIRMRRDEHSGCH